MSVTYQLSLLLELVSIIIEVGFRFTQYKINKLNVDP